MYVNMTYSENIFEGDFIVTKDMIYNGKFIEGKIPKIINGDFRCSPNIITSLKFCPEKDGGSFYCSSNNLTSLEFGPKEVNGYFDCSFNKLTSIKFCPKKVGGSFYCSNNQLTSLEFITRKVGGDFYCSNNKNNLDIEKGFIKAGAFKNDYYKDLLDYMISNKIDLEKVESWPEGFLSKNLKRSIKGKNKFNL